MADNESFASSIIIIHSEANRQCQSLSKRLNRQHHTLDYQTRHQPWCFWPPWSNPLVIDDVGNLVQGVVRYRVAWLCCCICSLSTVQWGGECVVKGTMSRYSDTVKRRVAGMCRTKKGLERKAHFIKTLALTRVLFDWPDPRKKQARRDADLFRYTQKCTAQEVDRRSETDQ